ncbi:MAG: NADPH-dependent FMN reductase [Halanaeroarchaeum sp.]
MAPTVAAVVGSLRSSSVTRIALRETLDAVGAHGGETDLIDLQAVELPVFDPDREETADVVRMRRRIRDADAVVLGTPVYHGSYASPLKVALDYSGFDEFEDTTVGLLAVAGGQFPIAALDHLRSVLRSLDAWVLPYQVAIPNASEAVSDGELVDDDIRERVETLGKRMVQYASIEPDPLTFEGAHNAGEMQQR